MQHTLRPPESNLDAALQPAPWLLSPLQAARALFSSKTASPLHNQHLHLLRLNGGALLAATGAAAALALAGPGSRARGQLGPRGAGA